MTASETKIKITEIFHSIQGESTLSGERFSFVRLTGCPLRCTYCDTTYSYFGGNWMTVGEILEEVKKHDTRWVLITGGEPLAHHPRTLALVKHLKEEGKNISIETDGEEDVAPYTGLAKIIMDIKTPSSGVTAKLCFENLNHLHSSDEIKFVIGSRDDYEWSREICRRFNLENKFVVLFSPVFESLPLEKLASWILEDKLNVRLQTQLHKHIWGKERTGV